jgi:hypothetical protein
LVYLSLLLTQLTQECLLAERYFGLLLMLELGEWRLGLA